MAGPSSFPIPLLRRSSRMAGGFEPGSDIRDDVSQAGSTHGHGMSSDRDDSSLLPPQLDLPSSLRDNTMSDDVSEQPMNTVLMEEAMHRRLADFESSFLPEPSAMESMSDSRFGDSQTTGGVSTSERDITSAETTVDEDYGHKSPTSSGFKTPTHEEFPRSRTPQLDHTLPNTSVLEQLSSSPTAARTVSRVQSMASMAGYETAAEREEPESPSAWRGKRVRSVDDPNATPRKDGTWNSNTGTLNVNVEDYDAPLNVSRVRPQYLTKRSSQARLSYDSMASSNTEASEATLGADFALQSGGAAPDTLKARRKQQMSLSRSTSLGSLASGVSNMSDEEVAKRAAGVVDEMTTLPEESPSHGRKGNSPADIGMVTPRASTVKLGLAMPTDSVIANHVRDLQVPDTVARKYRDERSRSPEKNLSMAAMTPAPKRGLTLKEHRSTVEKLGKENFDLKMKIHFLDQALQKRSEDGIKEMITENVQLKSDRLRLEKENHGLRKQNRELQRRLDEATGRETDDQGYATDEERSPTMEEEVLYLRERVEITEIEMEKLRNENIHKETEKRRLAEMVRSLGDSRGGVSDVGSREERDMWKDMLEAETIAREQAEEDARKLREDLARPRQDASRPSSKLKVVKGQIVSRSSSVDGAQTRKDLAELERLRHECTELQKTIGAQASALTSRNKEKEMLYQEIENLKLGKMGGLRSVAGDSILDRSASRARSNSRASNATRYTRFSDNERETLESRIDQLRDELSQLKLEKQNLQSSFDEALAELDAVDAQAQADADQFNEELAILTQERDNALRDAEEQDAGFQQLKTEAQEEIDGLGDELDAKIEECNRIQQDLKNRDDMVKALQAEMRSAAEGLQRLEQDAQQNLAKYQSVKAELEDSNRELENYEKTLHETQNKNERLRVQQESSRNEIAFLREEQDGDKIKIGDLESLLKKTHLNMDSERERARELERRLSEERAQRELVAGQEKQEIQKTINDLNREASTSKNELRLTKKALSAREVELTNFKDRLNQLEDSLRRVLGSSESSSSHLIGIVTRIVQDLDQSNMELDMTRQRLDEHKKLLADRDNYLEDAALENRRLEDMIEREQLNRRQDKHSFEQALKSHEQASRLAGQSNSRIAELEAARNAHRKQLATLESQYKDQLAERNQILLTIWRKLSAMCGPDWTHNHSLIQGNLPSQEVIGNMLFWPGFSRNLLLAAKQIDGVLAGFRDRVKTIERDLQRNYTALEKEFEARNKKLERIEEHWEKIKLREREIDAGLASSQGIRPVKNLDMQKLKNENKVLKSELRRFQEPHAHAGHLKSHQNTNRAESRGSGHSAGQYSQQDGAADAASINGAAGIPARRSSVKNVSARRHQSVSLSRNNSANTIDQLSAEVGVERSNSLTIANRSVEANLSKPSGNALAVLSVPNGIQQFPTNGNFPVPPSTSHSDATMTGSSVQSKGDDKKWIHRLRELERRLKVEREQRLNDRDGARRRLEERDEANKQLSQALERERQSRGWKADHADEGGYLVADEPMLEDFVNSFNRQQTEQEYDQQNSTDEQADADVDEQAQPPSVGTSHAQRAALSQRLDKRTRPDSTRTVSRGSIMSMSPRRPSSIRERIVGRPSSMYSEQRMEFIKTGDRWGRSGCDKEVAVPVDDGNDQSSVRRITRTASSMAALS